MLKKAFDGDTDNIIPVAPDLPDGDPDDDPDDPDDPDNPSDPGDEDDPDNPDDPDDIPIVDPDWIDKNDKNIAYRVSDSDNVQSDGSHDVSDMLPTTFAFYIKDDKIYDPIYQFTYDLSFFYETVKGGISAIRISR
jgi:hypothetical protein